MAMRARRVLNWHTSWDELKVEGDLPGRDGLVRFVKGGGFWRLRRWSATCQRLKRNALGKSLAVRTQSPNGAQNVSAHPRIVISPNRL